jgi:hypothetical protein
VGGAAKLDISLSHPERMQHSSILASCCLFFYFSRFGGLSRAGGDHRKQLCHVKSARNETATLHM